MNTERHPWSKTEWTLLGALLVLAAYLRFNRLDQTEFLWDQAEIVKWALRMARRGEIAWVGPPSSTGLYSFLGTTWLLCIPFIISPSPVVATGFVALLNVIAVFGCYLLTRRWFGRRAALVAALLFAVAPWGVIYSRKIWQVEMLAPFTLLYAYTGWRAFVHGKRWALLAHCLVMAWEVQIHFSALALMPLTAWWALLFWRRLDWRFAPLAALLVALVFSPYFIHDAQHDWFSVKLFQEMLQKPSSIDADALHSTWITATGLDLHWVTGPDRYDEFTRFAPNLRWLFAIEGVLAFGAGLLALTLGVRHLRCPRHKLDDDTASALLLATWLVMPILFQTRHNVPIAPHYFTTIFPAPYILVAWLLTWLGRQQQIRVYTSRLLLALVALLALTQTYETVALQNFVLSRDTLWGYETPICYDIRAANTTLRLARQIKDAEIILLAQGDEPRSFEMPATADVLYFEADDVPHRTVDIRSALILPPRPAIYWATFRITPGETLLSAFAPELPGERVFLRAQERAYRFYRWDGGAPELPDLQTVSPAPQWANGARLLGYQLAGDPRPGGTLHWTLVWQPSRTPGEDVYYHWFNHLLDASGQIKAQQDGPSVLPAYWRADDTIFNWFDIPIPPDILPGDYMMRVGMYIYPDIQNVPLTQPAGEWVEIGPVSIGP